MHCKLPEAVLLGTARWQVSAKVPKCGKLYRWQATNFTNLLFVKFVRPMDVRARRLDAKTPSERGGFYIYILTYAATLAAVRFSTIALATLAGTSA